MIKCKGKFKLDYNLICRNFDLAQTILSSVIIIRAENCFVTDKVTYWGFSKHFDEIPEHGTIPEYEAIITDGDNLEWRKVK